MKLRRDQQEKTGVLGESKGFDFVLRFQADLTPKERDLVKKYKVGDYVLGRYNTLLGNREVEVSLQADDLEKGSTSAAKDVTERTVLEDKILVACKNLKVLPQLMASFGGEEIIEI